MIDNKKESGQKSVNTNLIFAIFLILVFVGKIIRYTIMKTVLVDTGIGHFLIDTILYGNNKFSLLNTDSMVSEACGNAVVIFRLINIFKIDTYIGWEIYISCIWNLILICILAGVRKNIDIKQFLFIVLSIIVLNIFDFTLAKEPIQMLYFIAIYYILMMPAKSDRFRYIGTIGVLILSTFTFRAYYLLIIMFMIFIQVLFKIFIFNKKKIKIKDIIILLITIAAFYFVFLNVVKTVMPSQYAELIRVRTRVSTAASDMRNIFKSSNLVIFSLDYLLMLLRMLFPVELLALGVKYIPYVFYQLVITYFLIGAIKNVRNNGKVKNIALYLYIGFLFASATFEPDFGSWVRHETVLFPVLLIVANIKKKKYEGKK